MNRSFVSLDNTKEVFETNTTAMSIELSIIIALNLMFQEQLCSNFT